MSKTRCYQRNADGFPQLCPSLVGYLDILGYKSQVRAAYANDVEEKLLASLAGALAESRQLMESAAGPFLPEHPPSFEIKFFSDNIALGYPLSDRQDMDLSYALGHISFLQAVLAARGYLVRGGLAIGNIYMDENLVYGRSFIEATELDKSMQPPRIALTDELAADVLDRVRNAGTSPWSGWGREGPLEWYSLLIDSDETVFVNYLDAAFDAFPDGPVFTDLLADHRSTVRAGLECSEDKAKYLWAARYHNMICSEFSENRIYRAVPYETLGLATQQREAVGNLLIENMPDNTIRRIF